MHDPFVNNETQQPPSYDTKGTIREEKNNEAKKESEGNSSGFKHNSRENLSFIKSISGLMTCGFFSLHVSRIGLTFHKVGKWIKYLFISTLILKGMWNSFTWNQHSSQRKPTVSQSSWGQNCLVLFQGGAIYVPWSRNLKRLALDLCLSAPFFISSI